MRRWTVGLIGLGVVGVLLAGMDAPVPVLRPRASDVASRSSGAIVGPATRRELSFQDTFPHLTHQGLFPLCTGCHSGVPEGDESTFYPEPRVCQGCHDGQGIREVDYTPPVPGATPDNLTFSHPAHGQRIGETEQGELPCQTCHTPPGSPRMAVAALDAGRCMTCHGEPGDEHYVDLQCSTCHEPLARTRLPASEIADLPVPPDHGDSAFIARQHGRLVRTETNRCATCHTQQLCTTCHVDAATRAAVREFPAAPPSMELPTYEARYPVPASHVSDDFEEEHGRLAASRECSTCHTQDDCASCHLSPMPEAARTLPARAQVRAPGVGLMEDAPESHRSPFFMDDHDALAAASPSECMSCHTQPFCDECHQAPMRPSFHPADYVARHPADAWGRNAECASCHSTEAFCRSCHIESGLGAKGRLGQGFHDAEPLWLLRHGQAARQSLETCASCHTQRECLQCHSELGSFQVNPHGPDFDARRAWDRNPTICRACHVGDPFGGSSRP